MGDNEWVGLILLSLHPLWVSNRNLLDCVEFRIRRLANEVRKALGPFRKLVASSLKLVLDGFADAGLSALDRFLDALPDTRKYVAWIGTR